jgi:hypothetical protein
MRHKVSHTNKTTDNIFVPLLYFVNRKREDGRFWNAKFYNNMWDLRFLGLWTVMGSGNIAEDGTLIYNNVAFGAPRDDVLYPTVPHTTWRMMRYIVLCCDALSLTFWSVFRPGNRYDACMSHGAGISDVIERSAGDCWVSTERNAQNLSSSFIENLVNSTEKSEQRRVGNDSFQNHRIQTRAVSQFIQRFCDSVL